MLYSISRELEAALKVQHVPFPVFYGPERSDPVAMINRIVIQQGGPGADVHVPPLATHRNPKMHFNRRQGARVRIFARSSVSNAQYHDHEGLAEQVADAVQCELDVIIRARKNTWELGPGGIVPVEDAAGSSTFGGVVYEFSCTIDRGVERRTWEGAKEREEVVIGTDVSISSTTKVSDEPGAAGTPPVDAEDV